MHALVKIRKSGVLPTINRQGRFYFIPADGGEFAFGLKEIPAGGPK
jgi:hypothetical protein